MKILTILLLFIVSALSVFGQVADDRDADAVVRDYNVSSTKQDWSAVASLIHPDSLKEFRTMFEILVEKNPESASLMGVRSKGDLAVLSDSQLFERLFSAINEISPTMKATLSSIQISVVGTVEETPDLRHYVYRASFKVGPSPISKVAILSLKRFQSTWRVLMSDDEVRAMAASLSAMKPVLPIMRKTPSNRH